MNKEDLGNLSAFVVIAEEKSFTRAAARLGVSASALSHAMRTLEERLRIRLLHRSTRKVSTTDAGERLLAALHPALKDISQAVEDMAGLADRPSGHLRITTSRQAAAMVITPVLAQFVDRYPDVTLEILVEAGFTDIIEQRYDAGIRLGESIANDMISVPVSAAQRAIVVAAPSYLARYPVPRTPHDLGLQRCLGFRMPSAGTIYKWEFERDGHQLEVAIKGPLIFNDPELKLDAALAGTGLAYVFEATVADYLRDGRLVPLLGEWCAPIPGFFLYYSSRRQAPAALQALIDTLRIRSPSLGAAA
jgi:DNA-binding transcriptional LysR family regulator